MKFAAVRIATFLLISVTGWAFEPIVQDESIHNIRLRRDRELQFTAAVTGLELLEVFPGPTPDLKIKDLVNGDNIVRAAPSFNVNAVVTGSGIGSVRFEYNGNSTYKIENFAAYAFCGNNGDEFTKCTALGFGMHIVTAVPYSSRNGSGLAGTPFTVTFQISPPPQQVTSLELITVVPGPSPDTKFKDLANGDVITTPTPSFNINAVVAGTGIGSVLFAYNNNSTFKVENHAVYAFCGNNGDLYTQCGVLGFGTHTVTATPYTGANAGGIAGIPLSITFQIVDPNPPVAHPVTPPVAPPVTPPVVSPVTPPVVSPVTPPVMTPVAPPVTSPVAPPATPPIAPPVVPTVTPPVARPVAPSVEPPVTSPVTLPITPLAAPPVTPPVERPLTPPVASPVTPPVTPPVQPSSQPSSKPSNKPSSKPSTKPSTHPSSKPSVRPSVKPSCKPSTQPSRKPSARPSMKPSTVEKRICGNLVNFINSKTLTGRALSISGTTPEDQALKWLLSDTNGNIFISCSQKLQRYAVATLAFHNTDAWKSQNGWPNIYHECTWSGVECSIISNGHLTITSIILNAKNLAGTLPLDLGLLSRLNKFDIGNNGGMSGPLPSTYGMWTDLLHVDMSNGRKTGTIPTTVGSWRKLQFGRFDGNSFTGQLPLSIGQWSQVSAVDWSGNYFNGTIPSTVGNWSKVEFVSFSSNQFSGKLPESISQWSNLKEGYFYTNFFNGTIPTGVSNWNVIQRAWFLCNRFTGAMPAGICREDGFALDLRADCIGPSPEVTCSCCTQCSYPCPRGY